MQKTDKVKSTEVTNINWQIKFSQESEFINFNKLNRRRR